jgi:hypothetical protein
MKMILVFILKKTAFIVFLTLHLFQDVKRKGTNKDLQNTTQKTTDQATQTPLKTRGELRYL